MKRMHNSFSALHPATSLFYFICVFISFFLTQNPALLGVAFCSALLYQLVLKGAREALKPICFSFPLVVLMLLINPLFNHNGATVLFYLNDQPYTLEALYYGCMMALAVMDTIIWFIIVNDTINHDKIIFLFGRFFPMAALMLGMIFRVTGSLKEELKKVQYAQKSLGLSTEIGKLGSRLKNGAEIFICVLGNALEHSVDTAAAMKSRGYGLPGHSRRRQYPFHKRDAVFSLIILISFITICFLSLGPGFSYSIFPKAGSIPFYPISIIGYSLYAVFLNLPLLFEGGEALKWHYLNLKT